MITYEYYWNGPDQYKVIKRWMEGERKRCKEYLVSFKGGDTLCDCPGFSRWNKKCKHVKFLLAQLADKGGIINFGDEREFNWEMFEKSEFRKNMFRKARLFESN